MKILCLYCKILNKDSPDRMKIQSKLFLCICSVGEESGDSNEDDDDDAGRSSPITKRPKIDVEMSPQMHGMIQSPS